MRSSTFEKVFHLEGAFSFFEKVVTIDHGHEHVQGTRWYSLSKTVSNLPSESIPRLSIVVHERCDDYCCHERSKKITTEASFSKQARPKDGCNSSQNLCVINSCDF